MHSYLNLHFTFELFPIFESPFYLSHFIFELPQIFGSLIRTDVFHERRVCTSSIMNCLQVSHQKKITKILKSSGFIWLSRCDEDVVSQDWSLNGVKKNTAADENQQEASFSIASISNLRKLHLLIFVCLWVPLMGVVVVLFAEC